MKRTVFFLAITALFFTACSEEQMDAAMDGGQAGSIVADDEGNTSDNMDVRVVKPRWKHVDSFKGKKDQKTHTFKITADEWKISWSSQGNDDDEFIVILKNRNSPDDSEIIANHVGDGKDMIEYDGGMGEYYLDISATGPYSIQIEQYK